MLAENRKTEAIANSTIAAYEIELKGAVGWTTNAGKSGKRKRQRPRGLWRFILEDLAVLIGCCVFWLPSDQPPVCTGDQPFGFVFRLTSDFHRRSFFRRCLPTQPPTLIGCCILRRCRPVHLRLASPINLPALPADPTSDSYRLLHLRLRLPSNLRLAPSTSLPALPSNSTLDSSTVASLRRCRPAHLRLAPPINLPALPVDPTSDLSIVVFSSSVVRLTLDSRLRLTFRLAFRSTVHFCFRSIFRPAFQSFFGFRLRSTFQLRLRTQPPTNCVSSVGKDIRSAQPVHASANPSISVDFLCNPPFTRTLSTNHLRNCTTTDAAHFQIYFTSAAIHPCNCSQFPSNSGTTVSSWSAGGRPSPMCVPCGPSSKMCISAGTFAFLSAMK